jgi:hypothetical protein
MIDWKLIATVFIVAAVVFFILASHPDITDLFKPFDMKLPSFSGNNVARNITIELVTDFYENLSSAVNSDIIISGNDFTVSTDYGEFKIPQTLKIVNFTGQVKIGYRTVSLNGDFHIFRIGDFELKSVKGKLNTTDIPFDSLYISDFSVDRLTVDEASGSLTADGTTFTLTGKKLEVFYPEGVFEFSENLSVQGTAQKILIDEGKVSIS